MLNDLIPQIGWVDISPEEALELGFPQAGRWRYQVWRIEWFGFGLGLRVRGIEPV